MATFWFTFVRARAIVQIDVAAVEWFVVASNVTDSLR